MNNSKPRAGKTFAERRDQPVCDAREMTDLREALEKLHDLRHFVNNNATQWRTGAKHPGQPMWLRIATVLAKHGMNTPDSNLLDAHGYLRGDPTYRCS